MDVYLFMENISPNLKVNVGENRRNPDLQLKHTFRDHFLKTGNANSLKCLRGLKASGRCWRRLSQLCVNILVLDVNLNV